MSGAIKAASFSGAGEAREPGIQIEARSDPLDSGYRPSAGPRMIEGVAP